MVGYLGVVLHADIEEIYAAHVWHVYAFFGYRLSSREDAEDLTQLTFERATKAIGRYDKGRGSVRTWLLAIAHNVLVDQYRRNGARPQGQSIETTPASDLPAAPDGDPLGLEPEILVALSSLSHRDRQVVALRFGGDLTGPEIAELLDLSLANVQQILSRSLRKMRAVLEDERAVNEG